MNVFSIRSLSRGLVAALPLCLLALTTACTDPIGVGSDILDEGITGTNVLDIPIRVTTVRDDSLPTASINENGVISRIGTFTFGRLEDPVFGVRENSFLTSPTLPRRNGRSIIPSFAGRSGRAVDSVVLIIPLDGNREFYADSTQFFYDMLELASEPDRSQEYFTSTEFEAGTMNRVGVEQRFVATREARFLSDTMTFDSLRRPHVRFRLNEEIVERIDQATTEDFATDTLFREQVLAGVLVRPTDQTQGLAALRPRTANTREDAGFYVYFKTVDGADSIYRMPLNSWLPSYQSNFEGALADELVGESDQQEIALIAGQATLLTKIELTDLAELEDAIVNRAVLTLPVVTPEGYSYEEYPLPQDVALYYRTSNGTYIPIEDRASVGSGNSAVIRRFLGSELVTNDDGSLQYDPSLTVHLQAILNGEYPPVIYLRVVPDDVAPGRAVFATASAPARRARLRVTFTTL